MTKVMVPVPAVRKLRAEARMSCSRMRPPRPLPITEARSTPSSRARRRARGVTGVRLDGPGGLEGTGSALTATDGPGATGVAGGDRASGAASPSARRYPNNCPTVTVSPARGASGGTKRVPASKDSTSWAALSDSSTNRDWPACTWAPFSTSHSRKTPSSIDQPSRGTVISIAIYSSIRSKTASLISSAPMVTAPSRLGL